MIRWSDRTPARRFRILLAAAILLFFLIMSLVLYVSLDRYVIDDTARNTENAVQQHFTYLFGNMFDHQDHAAPQHMDKVIRVHFDIYDIEAADFFHPDGTIVYSYENDKIGQKANERQQQIIRSVQETRQPVSSLQANTLSVWLAVTDKDSGAVQGIVHVTRNISFKTELFRRILVTCLFALYLCGALLYFSLKRVFDRSTEQLEEKAEKIREVLDEIETTYDASLQALSSALDSRDNETNGHSFRVTAYTIRLAQEMAVEEDRLAHMIRGALLHDVGKIGVPDSILLKQGPLTSDEWTRMRSHVEIGYEMLKHIPFLQNALEIVRYHHERWDGNGYPHGINKEEIPLSARIFAVCDTYDAITSDRPYRKGRAHEEAVAEIAAQSGKQFDPSVVEAFLRIPSEEWIGTGRRATDYHEDNRQFERLVRFPQSDESKAG
ncbi:HD domain-containing phosphohydrolase [Brevibacillus sp. H7]|uniref:HD domain-containing phosphohydrolase n=1 Tax=Brevibacillus sp. H7 TaxID=3349138 RepID=UPI00381BAAD3